jgi:hypothetical protein
MFGEEDARSIRARVIERRDSLFFTLTSMMLSANTERKPLDYLTSLAVTSSPNSAVAPASQWMHNTLRQYTGYTLVYVERLSTG